METLVYKWCQDHGGLHQGKLQGVGPMVLCAIGSRDERMGLLKYFGFQMILLQVSDVGHRAARFTVLSSEFQC